jgi:probable rRNA maturation factor
MITLEPPRRLEASADPWGELGLSRAGLGRFVRTAQAAVGLRGEVEVLLADDRTLRRLNREFRGKDKATDVLSFPAPPELEGQLAGDLAISLDTALKQAQEQGHTLRDEVRVLLLHGLLHLYGMDHEVDEGEMAAREAVLRTQLRLRNGLIARVESGLGLRGRGKKQIPSHSTTLRANDNKKSKGKSQGKSTGTKVSAKKVSI